jgi:hypothetical protein
MDCWSITGCVLALFTLYQLFVDSVYRATADKLDLKTLGVHHAKPMFSASVHTRFIDLDGSDRA